MNLESPLVSVITPSFNQGKYIKATIESVLSQTYENIEFIVVDGGSSDDTINILNEYRSRITHLVIERDRGQSDAINKGSILASGSVIGWLNSDDILLPRAIEYTVDAFRHHTDLTIAYGDCQIINSEGSVIGQYRAPRVLTYEKLLNDRVSLIQPGSFYCARTFKLVSGVNPNQHFIMDRDLWLRLLKHGRGYHVGQFVSQFRKHENAKSTQLRAVYLRESLALDSIHKPRRFSYRKLNMWKKRVWPF